MPADSVPEENPLSDLKMAAFFLCLRMAKKERRSKFLASQLTRALNLSESPVSASSKLNHLPKALSPMQTSSHWRLRFQHINWGGGGHDSAHRACECKLIQKKGLCRY